MLETEKNAQCCCEHCSHLFNVEKEELDPKSNSKETLETILFIIGVVLFVFGILLQAKILPAYIKFHSKILESIFFNPTFEICMISYLLIGKNVILNVFKNITKRIIFDENFLMTLATVGAFVIGEYPEAVAVMLFYRIGEAFEDRAVNHSKKSIKSLLDIRPDYAALKNNDGIITKVSPENVEIGSLIVVSPGEKIPLDGIIVEGTSSLDTRALTGETMPRDVFAGDNVFSGSINTTGTLTVRTVKTAGESTVTKILKLVEISNERKTKAENFITKFARYYTPIVVLSAALLAIIPSIIFTGTSADWIKRALIFLVVSCPCALVISVPLSFFGGLGSASKNGILIKGGNFLEALHKIDTVVFDKTGTLTKGEFKVVSVNTFGNYTKDQLLYYCASAEQNSKHPAAIAICDEYKKTSANNINENLIANSTITEIPGFGVSAEIKGKKISAGNMKLMKRQNILTSEDAEKSHNEGSVKTDFGAKIAVYVAIDDQYAGCIILGDELKDTAIESVQYLKKHDIKVMMLSGDRDECVKEIADKCGIENYKSDLLPHEKLEILDEVMRHAENKKNVVFVGDGINDAPSIAAADIGIAIGAFGTDAAMEAADIVLMNSEPSNLKHAIAIAAKTHKIVMQNIIFALAVKAIILGMGALGLAGIWLAVFGDVGVTFIAVLNSSRNLRYNNK
ncbi:cadmium-translocating P-type ATPase [Spirochaetia bacterium]|nr:cadmium-translocating P-type ATPase [Spirochaetia bacterium]